MGGGGGAKSEERKKIRTGSHAHHLILRVRIVSRDQFRFGQ